MLARLKVAVDIFQLYQIFDDIAKYIKVIGCPTEILQRVLGPPTDEIASTAKSNMVKLSIYTISGTLLI